MCNFKSFDNLKWQFSTFEKNSLECVVCKEYKYLIKIYFFYMTVFLWPQFKLAENLTFCGFKQILERG
jgi:hypothetical protein